MTTKIHMKAPTWALKVGGKPVAKPRMSQRDKFDTRLIVQRYWAYANALQLAARQARLECSKKGIILAVTFHMPFPKSYTRQSRRELVGTPHLIIPDLKNLIAGVEDSLNNRAWADDSQIWCYLAPQKFWTDGPGLTVIHGWEAETLDEIMSGSWLSTGYPQDIQIKH